MSDRATDELELILLEEAYLKAKGTPDYKEARDAFAHARTAFKINHRDPEQIGGTVIQPPSVEAAAASELTRE